MEDKRKALYNALSGEYDLGTYEDFTAKLNDESKRRALYDAAGQDYNLGTYEEYSEKLGFGPSGSNVVPMFNDEPNASLGEPDAERGVGAGAREGWKGLKAGFQNLWGETANVFTGSSQDSINALNELNDMVRQGKDIATETENAWTDAGREIRTGAMELLPGWMIKGWKDRVLARAEKEKVLDDIREALGEAGGDVDKARAILEQRAQEMSYGDEQIAKAAEMFADVKPTEGFGAWVGSNVVQMIPSASALIVGAVTKSPAAAKAIGMIGMGGMTAATAGTSMYEARQAGATDAETWKVGITDGMIEYLTEKLPFDRYTSRIMGKVKGEVAQDLFSALRTNKATRTELEKLLVKANERLGGKLFTKKNLKDYVADMLAEGASEFSAEALQTMTSMMYENPEDYPTINEILTNGWEGAKAGFFMGAVLGGASKTMEHTQNRKRRMDKGSVDVALVDFGDGEKDVAEVVEYDASSNTAVVLHDGSFEKVSGDAIADGYRFSYEEFENARLRQMEDEAVVSGNVTEGQIQGLEDNIARDIEEIKALAPEMTESEISAILQSEMAVEPDTPLGAAVAKYQEDVARHDELVAAKRDADAAKKETIRTQIETAVGQRFWVQESGEDDGSGIIPVSETVEEVVYADGRVGYVVGSDESGNLTMVYTDGTKGFSSRAEITEKENSGEILSNTIMGLDDYLAVKMDIEEVTREQTRMAEEHALSVEEMIATHPQGSVINVGTEEAKIEVPIIAPPTKDGVIVQMPDGATPMLTWEDVAHAEKKEITPKTNAQLNQSIVDEYRVAYTPAAPAASQPTQQKEEQVKRTSPANPLPLKADGSVDQTALWNNDPERWAQWNDEQRQDGGANSLAYVSGAIAKEQAKIAELQAAYAAESDFDARDAIEKEIADTQARVERLTAIQQGYVAQAEAAAPVAETQPGSTLTARMASEMTLQELNDLDDSYDIILSQTRVPEEKARLLQEYLDRIAEGSTPIKVLTRDNYEDVMRAAGCPEADIAAVGRVMKRLKPGRAIAGFVSAESIFVMADGIPSISEARVTYVHERQHVINSLKADKVREMAIALGDKANALAVLEKFVGVDGLAEYENDPLFKLADEIIARCMEIAYTTEEFSVDLQSKGLSGSVISIIEEIDNEQRNDKSLIAARRSAHAGISRRTNAAQDGRNSGQVSGGILVGEENRSAGVGGQGTGTGSTGEGAEVISEEQLNAPNSGEAQQITAADGEVLADTDGKGGVRFSIRTWNEGGRDYLAAWLANDTTLTEEEKADIIARMDEFYKNALLYSDTYVPFGTWSDAGVRYDNNGNPLMSVIKANGDYAMNLDFSLVCKKRRPLNRLLRTLVNRNAFATYTLRERELAEINWILQEHGFEVACALCFVDSKRYRVTGVADVFAALYNRLVKSLAPEGVQIAHFNYNENPNVEVVENGLDTMSDNQLNWDRFDRMLSAYKPGYVEHKVAQYLREHPEARKLVDATDFIEAEGFESVKENNPDLLKFYNMKKGTTGPKASFGDVQYLNDILKKEKSFDAEKAYAVGGVRLQSFSDFVPHMYFDYMQLFAELAAKKLPLHAYTKEVLFAKIFGLTGAKINMSLVPAVVEGGIAPGLDAEGNYAWADPVTDAEGNVIQQGQSFPYDEAMAIQQAEGYSKNCGIIAVGISDAHIEKMMEDPNIPFIIPYHKSSLNAIVARMTNIDQYKDYTNVQNTRKASGSKLDKGTKDFNFNEYLHGLGESGTPQQAAQAYLDWCRENNYKPKFSQFAYHPNYYKLLQDFNTIDLATGEYAPQGAVTMTFPTEESAFGNVETLIQQGLQEDAELEEKMEQEIDGIANQVLARLEEISKEPKMSEKQRAKKMAELADERMAKIKAKAKGPIDLIEEAKKAQKKHEAKAKKEDIRLRVASEQDKAYMDAVEAGDMEAAQRMVDEAATAAGYTIRGDHGRVSKFTIFDRDKANPDGNWGQGFYFTNNKDDVENNYASVEGPDLEAKIEREVERRVNLAEMNEEFNEDGEVDEFAIREEVENEFITSEPNVVHAAIKMDNPFVVGHGMVEIGEDGLGHYDMQETYLTAEYETDEDGDPDYSLDPTGTLVDLVEALNEELSQYEGVNINAYDILSDNIDGMTASQFEKEARELLENSVDYLQNDDLEIMTSEIIRAAIERAGFDGIVDNTVNQKFGTARRFGRAMEGVNENTRHYIAFQSSQIKEADPVTYDDAGNVIPLSERFNPKNEDIRFRMRTEEEDAMEFQESVLEEFKQEYRLPAPTTVVDVYDRDAVANALGYAPEKFTDAQYDFIMKGYQAGGVSIFDPETKRIAIFAKETLDESWKVYDSTFHENTHFLVAEHPDLLELGEWLWQNSEPLMRKIIKEHILANDTYKGYETDEMLSGYTGVIMSTGKADVAYAKTPEELRKHWDLIFNAFGYGRKTEDNLRRRGTGDNSGRVESSRGGADASAEQKHNDAAQRGLSAEERRVIREYFPEFNKEDNSKGNVSFRTSLELDEEFGDAWRSQQDEMDAISATAIVRGNYLKAPNGADTNLTPEQWAMVRTKNFLNWFGDWINDPENASKVVDENGEPKVVFHGSPNEFNAFDEDMIGENTDSGFYGRGFYFATTEEESRGYGEYVIPAFLSMQNPLDLNELYAISDKWDGATAEGVVKWWYGLASLFPNDAISETVYASIGGEDWTIMDLKNRIDELAETSETPFADATEEFGIDEDFFDMMGEEDVNLPDELTDALKANGYDGVINAGVENNELVALYPSQIKSATDNTGEFSADNNDIRFRTKYDVNTNPTEAQKKAGNYKMGHIRLDGYNITIENPKGSVRSGTDSKGNAWENTLNNDYGYIRGTEGVDGDHIDVYLSDNPTEGNVFVIDQVNPQTREFDEHKVMYGFNSAEEAREAYLANFSEGWNGLGTITEVSKDEFKKWIESSHRKTKPFSEYKSVKAIEVQSEGEDMEDNLLPSTGTPTDEVVANGLQLTPAQTAEVAANIFAALPEESRKKITEGLNGNVLGLKDAILQIPTSLASKESWNEEDKQMAAVVAEEMTKMAGEMTRPFSAEEGLWLLYNNLNKGTDLISQASRALVQRNLGFDAETLAKQEQAKEDVRFRTVGDANSNAQASLYNRGAVNVWTRLKESFVDMQASVEELVKAIEKRTGKVAQGFENILLALNQQSSKGLAAMESYTQKFLIPMFDEIRRIMDETKMKYEDVVRYVILKHGLERNKKLAQRDARAHYQEIYDDIISKITGMTAAQKRTYLTNAQLKEGDAKAELARLKAIDQSIFSAEDKQNFKKEIQKAAKAVAEAEEHLKRAQKIASLSEQEAQDELDKIFEKIENGTDSVFKEMRENDYSGISSMFYDQLGVDRKNFSTEEQYQAALMEAKKDRYSSLKDIEAAAEAEVKSFEGKTDTKELWKRINAATKETLRQQYEANMISKDQYLNLRDMFEYYVPLRGFKDNTAEDMYTYYRKPNSTGYTKPILGAEGRKTEAESPFGWIAAMAGSAIASNVKNEAKLALYYFVSNRPENGIATISKTWFVDSGEVDERGKKIFKPAYPPFSEDLSSAEGKVQYEIWQANMKELQKKGQAYEAGQRLNLGNAVVNISDANKPEHIVNVKVGGKDYTIIINGNPRAAQAINGDLNIEGTAQDYSALFGPVLRWMSSVNTSYNPEFWITNMMRDMAFTMMAVNIKEDPAYRRKFKKNYLKAFKVISLVAKNEKGTIGDSYLEQQYKDFVKYGGVTGYTQIKDSETWEQEIENYLSSTDPESLKNGKVMRGMKSAFHAAHRFGESLEQVSRFAAFLTARETGKSINEAINDAKEITVNFNRKGSGKMITLEEAKYLTGKNGQPLTKPQQWMVVGLSSIAPLGRRFIMFFNAAIQGLNATYKLMKKNPKRFTGWALGYAAVGMMNAVLHAMLDDDDDYLDIPQYERRNSLMIGGNGAYFKWALPQEVRAFYALGDLAVETVMGRNPHQNVLGEALKIGTEILPVNPSEGWKAFMPSVAIPFIELALNEDYKGAPIYNEQKWLSEEEKERTAKWSNAYQGTGWTYVKIAQGLNFITGGDKHDAGLINLQPEKLEHLVQSAFGGTIRTADKFINTISAAIDPEEPMTIRQTPFLNRFLTINDERFKNVHVNDVFDYYKADAEHALTLEKQYIKDRDMDSLTELRNSDEYQWAKIYGKYKKPLKAIQDKIKVADGTAEKKELMKQQDELKKRMIKEISEL